MLQTLLPLIEGLAAEGGLLRGLGASAGGKGGLEALAGHFGFAKSFGGQAELGEGLRKISDLTSLIDQAKQSMEANRQKQEQIAAKAREDERLYMTSDPAHKDQLAQLEAQNLTTQQSMQQQQRQLSALNSRLFATNNPTSAAFRRAGTIVAGVQAAQTFGSSLLQQLPGVQAAQNVGGFLAGQPNAAIGQQMAQQAGAMATAPLAGAAKGAALGSILGPGGAIAGGAIGALAGTATEISKLPQRLMEWSEALVESKRHLMQFSPVLMNMVADEQRRGISRNIASAGRTGGTISEVSGKLQDLYDTLQPMRDRITVGLGSVLSAGLSAVNKIAGFVEKLVELGEAVPVIGGAIAAINDKMEKDKADAEATQIGFMGFLDSVSSRPGPSFPVPERAGLKGRGAIGRGDPVPEEPEGGKKPKRTGPLRPWRKR